MSPRSEATTSAWMTSDAPTATVNRRSAARPSSLSGATSAERVTGWVWIGQRNHEKWPLQDCGAATGGWQVDRRRRRGLLPLQTPRHAVRVEREVHVYLDEGHGTAGARGDADADVEGAGRGGGAVDREGEDIHSHRTVCLENAGHCVTAAVLLQRLAVGEAAN